MIRAFGFLKSQAKKEPETRERVKMIV